MKKMFIKSSLALGAVATLTACGGNSNSQESVASGKAFYVDSAVSGIHYKCGEKEGITSNDGSFEFEVGKSCTFYLGEIKLRDINKDLLVDGKQIVEDDEKLAALLQTLDTDGNPENGITITQEIIDALTTFISENGGDGTLPDTLEELETVVAALEEVHGYTGHAVTIAAATSHLHNTHTNITKALLVGKTLYQHCKDQSGQESVSELTFQNNGKIKINDFGHIEYITYTIEGNVIHTIGTEGNSEHTLIEYTDTYIKFDDHNHGETSVFYFSKADAEAAPAKACGNNENQQNGGSAEQSNTNPCHVNGNTVSADEGQTCNYEGHTVACQSGSITLDGSISGQEVNLNGTKFTCTK